ncbi:hypothetical protein H4582DRAFT_2060291 [Lactarius indigo]|nr:hypothetical protein H4582DRAFT_2060291 [Lactarius indigo]
MRCHGVRYSYAEENGKGKNLVASRTLVVHFEGKNHSGDIRPVVTLDFIVYQTRPKEDDWGTEEDNEIVLGRANKYSQLYESEPGPPQTKSGKRKARNSDEVAGLMKDKNDKGKKKARKAPIEYGQPEEPPTNASHT